jgi:hypothetical protein
MSQADPFDPDGQRAPDRRPIAWARLIPLVTLAILTAVVVWQTFRPEAARPGPAGGIGHSTPLPPPDDSLPFQAIRDEAPLQFSESAAYAELLDRARRTPLVELRDEARTDVVFSDLLARPERYRGLPIRLQGTARRILRLDDLPDRISPEGRIFEAWTFTADSRGFPYVLVFEDPPEGLPGGDDVTAFVVFHGYFFKLLAYSAADKPRKAPMLIGRLEYVPDVEGAAEAPVAPGGSRPFWLLAPIGLLVVYLFVRSMTTARSMFGHSSAGRHFRAPPRDEISPEELDDWLTRGPDDPDGPSSKEPS